MTTFSVKIYLHHNMVQVQMSTAGSRFVNSFVIQNIKLKPEKDSISFKLYVGIVLRIEDV